MRSAQKGFTLVEIAIVLVIIGLLLGGILKGQEMITQAKTKNLIADFSGVAAAFHGYQDRYRAIPGDDIAATRWTGTTAGSGNGILDGLYNAASATPEPESRLFWQHLRLSGFIAGSGANQPLNAASGVLGVQTGTTGGAAFAAFPGLIMCSSNLPDKMAIAVDSQMDDGNAITGTLRAQKHATTDGIKPDIVATALADAYTETSAPTIYTVCRAM